MMGASLGGHTGIIADLLHAGADVNAVTRAGDSNVLMLAAQAGSDVLVKALVERHAPSVRRLTAYLLADTQDAEDAAQEALAKLCTRIGQFRGEARFQTWLHSLVANTCRDLAVRQRRRRHQPLEAVPESPAAEVPGAATVALPVIWAGWTSQWKK